VKTGENNSYGNGQNESKNHLIDEQDYTIIRQVLNGSVNEYEKLINRYQVPIYNLFLRMLHDREEARELTQAAFVKAYESLPGFRFSHRFFSWLYRIAINMALNYLKKKKNNVGIEQLINMPAETEEYKPETDTLMKMAVDKLKDQYKAVVILKYYQQLSYRDIAFALDISEEKVRSRLYDARLKLKEKLEKSGYY
jgi:RNA polymerase sigma-70 factor, ECF subfamily